jgi:uncharacterized protein YkwD
MTRRVLVLLLAVVPILVTPAAASAMDAPERKALELVNASRERHDLKLVSTTSRLMRYAEHHARVMARKRRLFHSPLSLDGYKALGEIVGEGDSVLSIHEAFLRSSEHRKIMLGHWKWIGIGVASRNGTRYVTEVFAR